MMPVSGSEYSYITSFYGDCLGFLVAWVQILLLSPSGLAVVALTCATYILEPMYRDGCGLAAERDIKLLAIAIIRE